MYKELSFLSLGVLKARERKIKCTAAKTGIKGTVGHRDVESLGEEAASLFTLKIFSLVGNRITL